MEPKRPVSPIKICKAKTKGSLIRPTFSDPLECPRRTLAYGMTVSIPELDYWRDPKLGPPPVNNAPMPLSVCLLCHSITTMMGGNREDQENVETLPQQNQPSYQVCIGKGQSGRTLVFTYMNFKDGTCVIRRPIEDHLANV